MRSQWIPETSHRGINDTEVINLANRDKRIALTRDRDYLELSLRSKAKYGIIYTGEPARKDNVEKLAKNTVKALGMVKDKPLLAVVTSSTIELYPLT